MPGKCDRAERGLGCMIVTREGGVTRKVVGEVVGELARRAARKAARGVPWRLTGQAAVGVREVAGSAAARTGVVV
jgi:hypothetical protein